MSSIIRVSFPRNHAPLTVPVSHLNTFSGDLDADDHFGDWPTGWTHYIDWQTATAATYRIAIAEVERHSPEAHGHLDHLRSMRDIAVESIGWRADYYMRQTFGHDVTAEAEPHSAPIGPVNDPDHAARSAVKRARTPFVAVILDAVRNTGRSAMPARGEDVSPIVYATAIALGRNPLDAQAEVTRFADAIDHLNSL